MNRLPDRIRSPLLILVITILAYGVLALNLGFYRDDWYLLATAQSEGPAGIIALFQIDRPLIGYLYALAYRLLGVSPLAWQLTALGLRLIGNLAFLWLLRLLWPKRPVEALGIALLFSVYPGYSVQPNAGVYCTDLAAHAAAILSFALAIVSIRSSRPAAKVLLAIMAGLLELLYLGIFESAIGLEVGRLAILGCVVWVQGKDALRATARKTLRAGLLYILLAAAFLVWRLLIFQSTRRATNLDVLVGRYSSLPLRSALSIGVETIKDIFEATVLAWSVPFYQFVSQANYRDLAVGSFLAVVGVAAVLFLGRELFRGPGADTTRPDDTHIHMLLLGAVVTVFALLPIDLAGRNVLFADQWDRYTLYASGGVALMVGAMLFRFLRHPAPPAVLALLVGMSVLVHFFSAAWYRDFWTAQRDLWQQLVWRAPQLEPGTMLFVELPVGGFQEGYEIYGPANIVYYPGRSLQIGGDVINATTVANLQLQKNREHWDRSVLIADNYQNALVAVFPGGDSCLHVLDGRKVELAGLIDDSLADDAALYSRLDRILVDSPPAQLPEFLSGATQRAWCRYYQAMSLARQQGRWSEVARLADAALSEGSTPEDVSEWMPGLEAYATLGRTQDLRRLAAIIRSDDKARAFLCLQLQRGAAYAEPYDYNQVNAALCQAN